jgi:hypothetical protein
MPLKKSISDQMTNQTLDQTLDKTLDQTLDPKPHKSLLNTTNGSTYTDFMRMLKNMIMAKENLLGYLANMTREDINILDLWFSETPYRNIAHAHHIQKLINSHAEKLEELIKSEINICKTLLSKITSVTDNYLQNKITEEEMVSSLSDINENSIRNSVNKSNNMSLSFFDQYITNLLSDNLNKNKLDLIITNSRNRTIARMFDIVYQMNITELRIPESDMLRSDQLRIKYVVQIIGDSLNKYICLSDKPTPNDMTKLVAKTSDDLFECVQMIVRHKQSSIISTIDELNMHLDLRKNKSLYSLELVKSYVQDIMYEYYSAFIYGKFNMIEEKNDPMVNKTYVVVKNAIIDHFFVY